MAASAQSLLQVANNVSKGFGSNGQNQTYTPQTAAHSATPGIDDILSISQRNNVWSAEQAREQRDWQVQQNKLAMDYNAAQAAHNRNWQEYMSNSAHQREIRDLKAAGLNPILSAMGGNGAAVTSGATASGVTSSGAKGDTDTSVNGAIASILSSVLNAQTRLQEMNTNAITNLAVADKYNAMSKYTAELGSQTQITTANIHAMASKYASDVGANASKVSASIHAAAQKYGYDVSAMTQRDVAAFNATVNKDLAAMGYQHDFDIKTAFPNNPWQAAGSIFGQGTGGTGFGSAVDAFKNSLTDKVSGLFSGPSWLNPDKYSFKSKKSFGGSRK